MLSSEFCMVNGLKKVSTLRNSEVLIFGSIPKYCINSASTRTVSSGYISEVAAVGSVC